jgi:hypothetical protein
VEGYLVKVKKDGYAQSAVVVAKGYQSAWNKYIKFQPIEFSNHRVATFEVTVERMSNTVIQ